MSFNFKTIVAVLLLTSASLMATSASAGGKHPKKFVGTYYSNGGAMVSINQNGTMEHIVVNQYARNGRKVTAALGNWEKSGKNDIKVTWVRFLTEQDGDEHFQNGLVTKLSYTMQFDKPVNGRSPGYVVDGVTIENFEPGKNPTTDEPFELLDVPSVTTGTRLEIK